MRLITFSLLLDQRFEPARDNTSTSLCWCSNTNFTHKWRML